MEIEIKRIYEEADPGDGRRILVDRLWPRGISKEKAGIDLWCKEIAPSKELRTRYHKGDMDHLEFAREYTRELDQNPAAPGFLDYLQGCGKATFLFSSKNLEENNAVVLREWCLLMAGDRGEA
ncbi:DUF488 domain-containing protein [Mobilibacterium timonense]|uniref:DUF488 domain-containing protein n=1 Tax=Mobilibacterium timonense TaxID=1871012 RepID=UPI00235364E0|nr:DUF488 family protein [Mobilibacterium timonense]MBM6989858.1 DUF488 family protein [Mobilibacterium timonense]